MDVDFINLFRNSINNDYAKMFSSVTMHTSSDTDNSCLDLLIVYAILYDMSYYAKKFYEMRHEETPVDDISFMYADYNNDETLLNKLKMECNKEAEKKSLLEEIESDYQTIKYLRTDLYKVIKKRRKLKIDTTISRMMSTRIILLMTIKKYQYVLKLYGMKENPKFNRLYNWNVREIKRHHTVEDEWNVIY